MIEVVSKAIKLDPNPSDRKVTVQIKNLGELLQKQKIPEQILTQCTAKQTSREWQFKKTEIEL